MFASYCVVSLVRNNVNKVTNRCQERIIGIMLLRIFKPDTTRSSHGCSKREGETTLKKAVFWQLVFSTRES